MEALLQVKGVMLACSVAEHVCQRREVMFGRQVLQAVKELQGLLAVS